MLRIFGLVSALALFAAPASAQDFAVWHGDAFVENPSAACIAVGETAGTFFQVTLRPANLLDNGTNSHVAATSSRRGFSMRVAGDFVGGNQPYDAIGVGSRGSRFGGTAVGNIVSWIQAPPALTTQQYVAVTTRISNFAGTPGCTLTLRGYFSKRP